MRGVALLSRRVIERWRGLQKARTSIVDIMIVGAHKAGTSTLLRYLGAHPGVCAQVRPEMTYFMDPRLHHQDLATYRDRYFGVLRRPSDLDLVYVGKLALLMYDQHGLERLGRHNPDVQTVAILRDPVRRAYSDFWFARLKGREPLALFEEALRGNRARFGADHNGARRCEYLDHSLYAKHVERLYELFGRNQVHVFILEEFHRDSAATVQPLLRHFDLDPALLPDLAKTANAARRPRSLRLARLPRSQNSAALAVKRMLPRAARDAILHRVRRFNEVPWSPPPMNAATEDELRAYFAGPNHDLERLLGRDLSSLWPGPTR
jgi:hypothetical protein